MNKKVKWDEVLPNKWYYLCCLENQHIDLVMGFRRYPHAEIELLFVGDDCGQLISDFKENVEFYEVDLPVHLGEDWKI